MNVFTKVFRFFFPKNFKDEFQKGLSKGKEVSKESIDKYNKRKVNDK